MLATFNPQLVSIPQQYTSHSEHSDHFPAAPLTPIQSDSELDSANSSSTPRIRRHPTLLYTCTIDVVLLAGRTRSRPTY